MNPTGMIHLNALVRYLDDYLDSEGCEDYCPNGLQVEGRPEIRKLATGVSACREIFLRAAEAGADSILVHHGLFWKGMPHPLTGVLYQRIAELLRSGISLLAYHLPLDRHPEVGNNAVAARELGLQEIAPFGLHAGQVIGFRGCFSAPVPFSAFLSSCERLFGQRPLAFAAGPEEIAHVGIISGGAQKEFYQAIAAGLQVFVTGEASEWVMNVAREARVHYVAAGHYATERLGIRALGDHLRHRFGLAVEFIDVPNPV